MKAFEGRRDPERLVQQSNIEEFNSTKTQLISVLD